MSQRQLRLMINLTDKMLWPLVNGLNSPGLKFLVVHNGHALSVALLLRAEQKSCENICVKTGSCLPHLS